LHKRNSVFDLDSFSYWSLFFFMFSNEKHVFGMPFFLIKLSSYVLSKAAITFGLLTAIGFAFYTLHPASLIKECGTTIVIGWGMLIGGIALLICNRSFGWNQISQTFTLQTFSMLILIIISGTLSFLLYIGSLKYLAATETSILSSIEPLVAAIVSIAWLNESFGAYQLLGGVCIVLSVIFLTMPQKEREPTFSTEQI
ncbi:DMT family transporter, partial [Bacillus mycoides]|uniref:DMT family transporter n=1 Tax=Bacillus mycoides TaxID=1405 RepID=UPI003D64D64D